MTLVTDTQTSTTASTHPITKPSDAENKFLNVRDFITHQRLVTIDREQTLDKALGLMLKFDIRHLPVVSKDGEIVGILTERDLRLAATSPVIDPEIDMKHMIELLQEHKVGECMSNCLYTVSEDETILAAAKIMRLSKRGALPVTDPDTNKVTGIITQTDLLDHLIRVLEPLTPDQEQDEQISAP